MDFVLMLHGVAHRAQVHGDMGGISNEVAYQHISWVVERE